jgi:cytochrome c-type biogenesis protein CcmE
VKAKYIIGIIIIVVFAVWGVSAFLQTTVRYVSYAEAMQADRTVQIAGGIDHSSVLYDNDNSRLIFSIYDIQSEDPGHIDTLQVIYYGSVPGNFDQATSVMIRGKPGSEGFVAEQLMVKCPSKYQGYAEGN